MHIFIYILFTLLFIKFVFAVISKVREYKRTKFDSIEQEKNDD